MHNKAFGAQCAAVTTHCDNPAETRLRGLALFALALGSFCIGTSEFASMGILQLFSAELGLDIPTATHAITAYAFGVVIGGPAVTLAAARLNRRTLLLGLMGLFIGSYLVEPYGPLAKTIFPAACLIVGGFGGLVILGNISDRFREA